MSPVQQATKRGSIVMIVLAFAIAIVLILIPIITSGVNTASAQANVAEEPTPTTSASPSSSASPSPSAASCPEKFVQRPADRGELGRFVKDGFAELTGKEGASAEEKRIAVVDAVGHDVILFADLLNQASLWNNSNNTAPLLNADKTCLSQEGQDKYSELKGALFAAGTKVENVAEVEDGHNTSVQNGQVVADVSNVVTGDKAGWRVTFADGSYFERLDRCLNGIRRSKPDLPEGPTDNPPPPPTPPHEETPPQPGKRVELNIERNPKVDSWKKDGGQTHSVNENNGATDSRGYQADPQGDAQRAAEQAAQQNQQQEQQHQEAQQEAEQTGAGEVATNQEHTPAPTPGADW